MLNPSRIWLGYSVFHGIDRTLLVGFSWQMGLAGRHKMASLTFAQGEMTRRFSSTRTSHMPPSLSGFHYTKNSILRGLGRSKKGVFVLFVFL